MSNYTNILQAISATGLSVLKNNDLGSNHALQGRTNKSLKIDVYTVVHPALGRLCLIIGAGLPLRQLAESVQNVVTDMLSNVNYKDFSTSLLNEAVSLLTTCLRDLVVTDAQTFGQLSKDYAFPMAVSCQWFYTTADWVDFQMAVACDGPMTSVLEEAVKGINWERLRAHRRSHRAGANESPPVTSAVDG